MSQPHGDRSSPKAETAQRETAPGVSVGGRNTAAPDRSARASIMASRSERMPRWRPTLLQWFFGSAAVIGLVAGAVILFIGRAEVGTFVDGGSGRSLGDDRQFSVGLPNAQIAVDVSGPLADPRVMYGDKARPPLGGNFIRIRWTPVKLGPDGNVVPAAKGGTGPITLGLVADGRRYELPITINSTSDHGDAILAVSGKAEQVSLEIGYLGTVQMMQPSKGG